MTNSMDLFEQAAKKLLKMPEKLLALCMEQYRAREREKEARIKAENIAEERKRANEAMARGIREEREHYKKTGKELEKYKKGYEEKTRKMETLAYDKKRADERYDRASEEITDLKGEIDDLNRKVSSAEDERDKALKERDMAQKEAEYSQEDIERLQGRLTLQGKARFDTTSEKTSSLFAGVTVEEDPLDENADPEMSANHSAESVIRKLGQKIKNLLKPSKDGGNGSKDYETKGKRRKGKQEEDLAKIHLHIDDYNYTKEELDKEFKEGRYRVFGHNCKQTIERTRPAVFVRNEYSPKVEIKDEDGKKTGIKTVANKNGFNRRNSKASASIVTSTFYDKGVLGIPLYRQEKQYESLRIPISRQTMSNWYIHYGRTVFVPIQRYMMLELDENSLVRQCDETTWKVVIWPEEKDKKGKDISKKNGSRGYIWVHTTGEFTKGHKVVVYKFDRSRSTEHLRRNVRKGLEDLVVYLVSDAYSAYKTLEKESGGTIKLCGCWMHCRRKFAEAVDVLKPWMDKKMTGKEILEIPEVKGLVLSNDIFHADTPLKALKASERHKRRQKEVTPLADKFFEFVQGIDLESKDYSDKFREAITYAVNNETELRRFLENGNIPIDNGLCERKVKTIALIRKNSLFSFSMTGAEVNAAVCTAIETARANGADVYTYLKFLITEMPDVPEDVDLDESGIPEDCSYLSDMMPWSEKYKKFEKYHLENHIDEIVPESNELPEGVMFRPQFA